MDETERQPTPTAEQNRHLIPLAIVVAGAMVAGAVWYSRGITPGGQSASVGRAAEDGAAGGAPPAVGNIRPVTSRDHLRGDPEAPVKVIEFSDLECPFCKRFHVTMQQVMAEYGKAGKVAWVYRHFPLDSIHSKARKEAEATECAAQLGGNEKFWAYADRLFEVTPSNNGLDLLQLSQIAEEAGLKREQFEQCLRASEKFAARIEEDYQDAISSGGQGTPYSIVIAADGKKLVISGAQPYTTIKQIIEAALAGGKE